MGLAEVSSSALYDNNRHINQRENVSYGNNLTAALNDSRVKYDILYTGDLNHNITQKEWDSYDNGDCCGEAGAERMVRQRMADRLAEQYGGSSSDWYDILMAEDAEAGMKAGTHGAMMIGGEALFALALKGIRGVWAAWIARSANTATSSSNFLKLLKPIDEFDEAVTLFRGTTGTETGSVSIFLTDNATVAATYIKNGGQVVSYRISQFALKHLEQSGVLTRLTGMHGKTGVISTEYQFIGRELVKAINQLAK